MAVGDPELYAHPDVNLELIELGEVWKKVVELQAEEGFINRNSNKGIFKF